MKYNAIIFPNTVIINAATIVSISDKIDGFSESKKPDLKVDKIKLICKNDESDTWFQVIYNRCILMEVKESLCTVIYDSKWQHTINDLNKTIYYLSGVLNNSVIDALLKIEIKTIKQLIQHSKQELLKARGIGPRSIKEIEGMIKRLGLRLKYDYDCEKENRLLCDIEEYID